MNINDNYSQLQGASDTFLQKQLNGRLLKALDFKKVKKFAKIATL